MAEGTLQQSMTVDDYAQQYQQLMDAELPVSLGFSARLNMLWDLSGAAPSQIEGRVISVLAINREWRESDVRKWLQKDVLPSRLDLHNMVKFLLGTVGSGAGCQTLGGFSGLRCPCGLFAGQSQYVPGGPDPP